VPPVYNALTDRTDAGPLIPEDASDEIWKGTTKNSYIHSNFRVRRMTRAQQRIPVLATKASSFWITGDTGLKPTTEIGWENAFINAEEQAAIVVIPDNVVADADVDLWDEYRPEIEESLAVLSDDTVLFGVGKPASFPVGIVAGATAAGNVTQYGTSAVDWLDDLSSVMSKVEADGYQPDQIISKVDIKGLMRTSRDANKGFLFAPQGPGGANAATMQAQGSIFDVPLYIDELGLTGWGTELAGEPATIVLDKDAFVIGRRKDLAWKTADTGVITDAGGLIVLNLFQQDASALRVTTRWGWQVKNPINRLQPVKASRYPAGVATVKVGGGFGQSLSVEEQRAALERSNQPALTETAVPAGAGATTTRERERARTNNG
jgi:HK97 family phage major capsid protein